MTYFKFGKKTADQQTDFWVSCAKCRRGIDALRDEHNRTTRQGKKVPRCQPYTNWKAYGDNCARQHRYPSLKFWNINLKDNEANQQALQDTWSMSAEEMEAYRSGTLGAEPLA